MIADTFSESGGPARSGLLWLELAGAAAAGAIWYLEAGAGPWPLLLVLAPWVLRWAVDRRLSFKTGFDLPLLLFVLLAGLSVSTAFDRLEAWAKFWRIVGGVALFYAFCHAHPLGRKLVWLLSLFGAGVAVYFLATHDWEAYPAKIAALTRLGHALQRPLPSSLPLHRLHPNVAGGLLAMMVPFAGLVLLWSWRDLRDVGAAVASRPAHAAAWLRLGLGATCLWLILFGLLMSTSRGAWIALGCALFLAALWNLTRRVARSRPALHLGLLSGLVILLLLGAFAAWNAWPERLVAVLNAFPGPSTVSARVGLLRNSLSLVRDYPFVGAGLGSFQMLYSTYALFLHVGYSIHSHNLLGNVAVEQGVPAALLLVWMWLTLGRNALSQAGATAGRNHGDGARERVANEALGAAVLCLVVVVVHGMVDDVLYGSRAVLLLFLPLAFGCQPSATRTVLGRTGEPAHRRQWLLPVSLALLLALALAWRAPLLSMAYSNLGAIHQSRAELSVYSWPEWPLQDQVRRSLDLSLPIAEFERALALDPQNPTANRRLGMIDLSLGRYEQALERLEAAYASEPGSEVTRSLLGEAYLADGRLAEGKALWDAVGNDGGRLAARVFWYGYIGDKDRQEWMSQAAEGR